MKELNEVLKILEEREKKEGTLSPLLEFHRKLIHIQAECNQEVSFFLTDETINERLKQGHPILNFDELELDWLKLRLVFEKIIVLFADYAELFGKVPDSFTEIKPDWLLTRDIFKAWFEGLELPVGNTDRNLSEDIIQTMLSPVLANYAHLLQGKVDEDLWRRRYCPVCGGKPDFAFLEKETGARYLLCSRCNAQWLFQRLECPCCGSTDQNTLAYYTNEEQRYRLYVCDKCRHYIKAVDMRKVGDNVLLPLERFMTLDIDAQAQQDGYRPCTDENTELKKCDIK